MVPSTILDGIAWQDPYSATIEACKRIIAHGLKESGAMSEAEFQNLLAIEEFIRSRDNS